MAYGTLSFAPSLFEASIYSTKLSVTMKCSIAFWACMLFPLAVILAQHGDCSAARILCNKQSFVIDKVPDAGLSSNELGDGVCFSPPFPESNVVWLKWEIAAGGTLGFSLIPLYEQDDLDFVLFRLTGALSDCEQRTELRCMVAGKILGELQPDDAACTGATGLRAKSFDSGEPKGCSENADNFLSELEVKPGERYALFINNFRSGEGFAVAFSGDCTFRELDSDCTVSRPQEAPAVGSIHFTPLSPNPAKTSIKTTVSTPAPVDGYGWMLDAQGRLIQEQPIALSAGESVLVYETAALPSGVYFIKIRLGKTAWLSRFEKE